MSIKEKIKNRARAALGIPKLEEEIRTLHYFLDELGDIEHFPKATGALRQLQLCDTELLKILDVIFEKNDLQYFLFYGTLLGGVRHKGFIPWDDDLDIVMPRESYDRAVQILREECPKLGFRFYVNANKWFESMGVGLGSGTWCDIFVIDSFAGSDNLKSVQDQLQKVAKRIKKYAAGKEREWKAVNEYRNRLIAKYVTPGNTMYYYRSNPKSGRVKIYAADACFPTHKALFEDTMLNFPNDSDAMLTQIYGNYMDFPKTGVLRHGTANVAAAGDSSATLEKLNAIYHELTASQE